MEQIDSISTCESVSELPEKRQTISITFHDILPPHCITTADRSAGAYYGHSKFFRRFTEPATSSTSKTDTSHTERPKKSSGVRRSTLQTMREYIGSTMSIKSSKKDGSAALSGLFSNVSEKKRLEGNPTEIVYEYDSDEETGAFEERKVL